MKKSILTIAAGTVAIAALGSASFAGEREDKYAEVEREAFKGFKKVGEPISCISTYRIQDTDVVNNQVIDFEVGNKTYRNVLPNRCGGLTIERAFSYKTHNNRLCSVDVIRPLQTAGGLSTLGGCGLGKFQQVEKVEEMDKSDS